MSNAQQFSSNGDRDLNPELLNSSILLSFDMSAFKISGPEISTVEWFELAQNLLTRLYPGNLTLGLSTILSNRESEVSSDAQDYLLHKEKLIIQKKIWSKLYRHYLSSFLPGEQQKTTDERSREFHVIGAYYCDDNSISTINLFSILANVTKIEAFLLKHPNIPSIHVQCYLNGDYNEINLLEYLFFRDAVSEEVKRNQSQQPFIDTPIEKIAMLANLLETGVITQEEFNQLFEFVRF
jgi:hypothetical protein